MRLLHSACGYPVETTTDRISVRVLDVMLEGEDTLRECLLDLVPSRSGKITCFCPKCKEPVDVKTELSLDCVSCGNPVPITRVFKFKPEYYVLCERCYVILWKRYNGKSSAEDCELTPFSMKVK